jgi:hypothetical protein
MTFHPQKVLLIFGLAAFMAGCQPRVGPPPTPAPTPDNQVPAEPPAGWTQFYDAALEVNFTYPATWQIQPASGPEGESAVASFDLRQTPDVGGIPPSEIKVGITRFNPATDRQYQFDSDQVLTEEAATVDGYPATRRTFGEPLGGSIAIEVPNVEGYTYLVSAYPPDSELIATFEQILDLLDLDRPPPLIVSTPPLGTAVTSPLTVTGQAPGSWFFEADFPLSLHTATGDLLAEVPASTAADWMTPDLVPFNATLEFTPATAVTGYLLFNRDNPSGLPEQGHAFSWPVRFTP